MTVKITSVVNDMIENSSGLNAEHGLSFWIQTEKGVVLLDTGRTAVVLSHNLEVLDLLPQNIDMLVLSHAHYEHTGGLEAFLSRNTKQTLFAHSDIFRPRYSFWQGEYRSYGLAYEQSSYLQRVVINLSDLPTDIIPNILTTAQASMPFGSLRVLLAAELALALQIP